MFVILLMPKTSSSKRHFKVVIGNKEHGLYCSSSPSSAARKAVSKLCATDKKKKVEFSLREITRGSDGKTYGPYLGHIEKLKVPIQLKGRLIEYKPNAKLIKKTEKKITKKTGVKKGGVKDLTDDEKTKLIHDYAQDLKASAWGGREPNNTEYKNKGLTNEDIKKAKNMVFTSKI